MGIATVRMPKSKKKQIVVTHPTVAHPTGISLPAGTVVTPTSATTTGTPSAPAQATPPTPSIAMVSAPPTDVVIPSPPAGFTTPKGREFLGYLPSVRELAAASTAVSDLAKFSDYVALLGSAAPAAATVSAAITVGIQWAAMRTPAEAWEAYVRAQYGLAWKEAMALLDELKPLFLHALAKNPALASQYQGLTQMFDAPKVVAAKAVATKKKNAKSKAATTTAAKSTAAAAPVEGATPTEPADAATKAVTINA